MVPMRPYLFKCLFELVVYNHHTQFSFKLVQLFFTKCKSNYLNLNPAEYWTIGYDLDQITI